MNIPEVDIISEGILILILAVITVVSGCGKKKIERHLKTALDDKILEPGEENIIKNIKFGDKKAQNIFKKIFACELEYDLNNIYVDVKLIISPLR